MQEFQGLQLEVRGGTAEKKIAAGLVQSLSLSPLMAQILVARGITDDVSARRFLSPSLKDGLADPHQIKNMRAGAELIVDAVQHGLQITVYSDFDVDGITSGTQLLLYLRSLGARVNSYIPSRHTEGYGLQRSALEKLVKAGTQLLVTLDCGITSINEIAFARRVGMKTVVVDHHQPAETLPDADVIIDPAQGGCPFADYQLAAAGLTWMLLIVLRRVAEEKGIEISECHDPKAYLDLAALGTICDMVPLRDINRVISFRGLEMLNKVPKRIGLQALCDVAGISESKDIGSGAIGFNIGPRINAAGRMGEAKEVVDLLTTGDRKKAKTLAGRLDRFNAERQNTEEWMKTHGMSVCQEKLAGGEAFSLAVFNEKFHVGVIGIVAQRLMEKFYLPAAVMAPGEEMVSGELIRVIKGSVRSVRGFHVAEILKNMDDVLIRGGGHESAGGFTLEVARLEQFIARFEEEAAKVFAGVRPERCVAVDAEVGLREIDIEVVGALQKLAPFGVGNPTPVFFSRKVEICNVSAIGQNHARIRLKQGDAVHQAVLWGGAGHPLLRTGRVVDVVFQPELNSYKGITSVQLNLRHVVEPGSVIIERNC